MCVYAVSFSYTFAHDQIDFTKRHQYSIVTYHKGKPGPFAQCDSTHTGQNRIRQYSCMHLILRTHVILCKFSERLCKILNRTQQYQCHFRLYFLLVVWNWAQWYLDLKWNWNLLLQNQKAIKCSGGCFRWNHINIQK